MLIMPGFQKSLIVEEFQRNYLKENIIQQGPAVVPVYLGNVPKENFACKKKFSFILCGVIMDGWTKTIQCREA